ncbi:MAG: metallopeptidase family protein [Vicinamibacterales bacterium]
MDNDTAASFADLRLQGPLPARSQRPPQPCECPDDDHDDFTRLVRDTLDELPHFPQKALADVPVIVSDDGHTFHPCGPALYGPYEGGTVIDSPFPSRILIFRDTLVADYGHDPDELRRQVTITVRHELAHHLGEMSEHRIRELGQ